MQNPPSHEGLGSVRPPRKAPKKSARQWNRRSIVLQLRDLGLTPTVAEALLIWGVHHGIDMDFTMSQLAEAGECDRSTISKAMPDILASGLVIQCSPHSFHGKNRKENRRGRYRLTEAFYALLGMARKAKKASPKRENFPSPLAFSVPIFQVPTQVEHKHQGPAADADAPRGTQEAQEPHDVVQAFVQLANFDENGARAAARALPQDMHELLPYLIQAGQAEVERRRAEIRKTKEHFLHYLITRRDPQVCREAKRLFEKSKAILASGRATGASSQWTKASPSFRAIPGAIEALHEWGCQRRALLDADASATSYSDLVGLAREARLRVVDLAAASLPECRDAEKPCLEGLSLVNRRAASFAWEKRILGAAGLSEWI